MNDPTIPYESCNFCSCHRFLADSYGIRWPCRWGDKGNKRCKTLLGHECWLSDPTMAELTAQTRAALEFADSSAGDVKSVLISAWNENGEEPLPFLDLSTAFLQPSLTLHCRSLATHCLCTAVP